MKSTHLPKLEGRTLKNWYVAQLHELITKCLDGLSPRWNQTETSFSYDDILTINRMGYVIKDLLLDFWFRVGWILMIGKMLKNGVKTSKIIKLNHFYLLILFWFVFDCFRWLKKIREASSQSNNTTSFHHSLKLLFYLLFILYHITSLS